MGQAVTTRASCSGALKPVSSIPWKETVTAPSQTLHPITHPDNNNYTEGVQGIDRMGEVRLRDNTDG